MQGFGQNPSQPQQQPSPIAQHNSESNQYQMQNSAPQHPQLNTQQIPAQGQQPIGGQSQFGQMPQNQYTGAPHQPTLQSHNSNQSQGYSQGMNPAQPQYHQAQPNQQFFGQAPPVHQEVVQTPTSQSPQNIPSQMPMGGNVVHSEPAHIMPVQTHSAPQPVQPEHMMPSQPMTLPEEQNMPEVPMQIEAVQPALPPQVSVTESAPETENKVAEPSNEEVPTEGQGKIMITFDN